MNWRGRGLLSEKNAKVGQDKQGRAKIMLDCQHSSITSIMDKKSLQGSTATTTTTTTTTRVWLYTYCTWGVRRIETAGVGRKCVSILSIGGSSVRRIGAGCRETRVRIGRARVRVGIAGRGGGSNVGGGGGSGGIVDAVRAVVSLHLQCRGESVRILVPLAARRRRR